MSAYFLLGLCVVTSVSASDHANAPADVFAWDFSNGTYSGDLSQADGRPWGSGNMTWEDGRTVDGRWEDGCPVQASIYIPPRDKYE